MGKTASLVSPIGSHGKWTRRPLVPEFDDSGLCLLESQHSADFRMQWTQHPYLKVITALRGSGEILARTSTHEETRSIFPGRIGVIFDGVSHRIRDLPGEPLLLYILCVGSGFPFRPARQMAGATRWLNDSALSGKALQILREIAALSKGQKTGNSGNKEPENCQLLRCGLVATLLGRLLSSRAGQPRDPGEAAPPDSQSRVKAFISRLDREFFLERGIDAAAAELGLSRRRFTQLFSELAGESYASHIQRLRLAHACRLLREKRLSPVTVAFECGYGDAATFYRAFKKRMGIPPLAWADSL